MSSSKQIVFLVITFFCAITIFQTVAEAQYAIPKSVIAAGGNKQSNSTHQIIGTAGQNFIGKSQSSTHSAFAGFWFEWQIVTDVEKEDDLMPTEYRLEQNYPNPFNPSTTIKFSIPGQCNVVIKVYDILGGEVTTLVNEELDAGRYEREFSASSLSSGVYIYRMKAGNYISTKKMLLIK